MCSSQQTVALYSRPSQSAHKSAESSATMADNSICVSAGASGRVTGGHSSLVSPESSVGGISEHQYQYRGNSAAVPGIHNMQSRPIADSMPDQQQPSLGQPRVRPSLPDLESSQPGPIEIDTSMLYTPQSGNSSTDVSHSGTFLSSLFRPHQAQHGT